MFQDSIIELQFLSLDVETVPAKEDLVAIYRLVGGLDHKVAKAGGLDL